MIDRVCVKVQDHLNSLKNSETEAVLEDVRSAESLIRDARNSKTVRIAKRLLCTSTLDPAAAPAPKALSPPLAAAQPLSLGLGCPGGAEQQVSGAHSGEAGVHGWRSDDGDGPAAAGREDAASGKSYISSRRPITHFTPCICLELAGADGGRSGISLSSRDEEEQPSYRADKSQLIQDGRSQELCD